MVCEHTVHGEYTNADGGAHIARGRAARCEAALLRLLQTLSQRGTSSAASQLDDARGHDAVVNDRDRFIARDVRSQRCVMAEEERGIA